jgi:hypothetical protein
MTRDMTATQFKQAATRHGFAVGLFGLERRDLPGCSLKSYGYVMRKLKGSWTVWRRQSLAKAINLHDRDLRAAGSRS